MTVSDGQLGFDDVVEKKPNPAGGGSIFTMTKAGVESIERIREKPREEIGKKKKGRLQRPLHPVYTPTGSSGERENHTGS